MVCRYDKHIVIVKLFKKFSKPRVKIRKRLRVAVYILSVAVNHVKIDEISEAKTVEVFI